MYSTQPKKPDDNRQYTDFEIAQIEHGKQTALWNNFFVECVDFATDLAFIFVLFDQAGKLEASPLLLSLGTFFCPLPPPPPAVQVIFYDLGVAATFFFVANVLFRCTTAVAQIGVNRHFISGVFSWIKAIFGIFLTILDPWSGSLWIQNQMPDYYPSQEWKDYDLAMWEIYMDVVLVILENLPQLVIQIIYAVVVFRAANLDLTPAWYVSTSFTIFHLVSQSFEVISLVRQLPKLKAIANTAVGV